MNLLLLLAWSAVADVPQAGAPPAALKHFEAEVRPLFIEKCQKCHGPTRQRGGLRLDGRASILAGGDNGPAVVPGDASQSKLIQMVRGQGKAMPPDSPLSAKEIAALEKWVNDGAAWTSSPQVAKSATQSEALALRKPGPIRDEERQWWAFLPVRPQAVPATFKRADWAKTPIDRFLLARMEAAGTAPAPQASPEDLLRRVTLALTGLTPTPAEIDAWKTDHSEAAYERLIDRLLSSRSHAEAWATRWLDLVRYADSDGYRIDHERPHAWRFRDYVIDSFHENRPMNRFLQEQIAGDELFPGDPRGIVAIGFLRHGIYEYNSRDPRGQWNVILNDITDTVGDAFLGLGFQCARCHDHKYDPILQVDYFRLRAFFANILPREEMIIADRAATETFTAAWAVWEKQTKAIAEKIAAIEKPHREAITKTAVERFPPEIQAIIKKAPADRLPLETQLAELCWRQVDYDLLGLEGRLKGQAKEEYLALKRELAKFDAIKPKPLPCAQSLVEPSSRPAPTPHPKKPNEDLLPGFLTLLDPHPASISPLTHSSGRRSAFALWLTRDDNPHTARTLVNRVWAWHMGRGIALQPSDAGRLGGVPTHPELLEWLTDRFVKSGWNLRELHRLILLSAFYRQSTLPESDVAIQADPDNRLYTRHEAKRLAAEEIRDCLYLATGELKPASGGPGNHAGLPCRSVYLKVLRNARNPFLDLFDLPQSITSTAMRDSTTTALQSLMMWNGPQLLERSRAMTQRLFHEANDPASRVILAWKLALSREPSDAELARALEFLKRQEKLAAAKASEQVVRLPVERMPHHEGQAVRFSLNPPGPLLESTLDSTLERGDFTAELFFMARSVADTSAVRTLLSRHDGNKEHAGWSLGVTGKQSRRKPQTLVMQFFARDEKGKVREIALFSDQKVELNHPCHLTVSVKQPGLKTGGKIVFLLRDLSNPDEPAQEAVLDWAPGSSASGATSTETIESSLPMRIGSRVGGAGATEAAFDGLIDDVRISRGFSPDKPGGVGMAATGSENAGRVLGRWTFESQTGMLKDLSGNGRDLKTGNAAKPADPADFAAMTDLCHVLFNSSGFLYAP